MEKMHILQAEVGELSKNTHKGIEYIVIPVIALMEGVFQASNSASPELILESTITKTAMAWNGQPAFVDHPMVKGLPISANSPEILETEQIGIIFNTKVEDKKLKFEVWVEKNSSDSSDDRISETVDKIFNGDVIEVSTSFFADVEAEDGTFEGKEFKGILSNIIPDHIAILSKKIGACSIEDGCGTNRINEIKIKSGKCECKTTDSCTCGKRMEKRKPKSFEKILKTVKTLFGKNITEKSFVTAELSDNDTRKAIESSMDTLEEFNYMDSWIVAVFSDSFVYATWDGLFQRAFEISEDGSVTIGEEVENVRPETEFVVVKTNEELDMNKTEQVTALISNEKTQFTDEDQDFLMSLEEVQLTKMEPVVKEEEGKPDPEHSEEDSSSEEDSLTAEQYINAAPPEVAEVLKRGMEREKIHRDECVNSIKTNSANTFTDDELSIFNTAQLDKLTKLSVVKDFTGRGGPRTLTEDPNAIPAPPKVFEDYKAA